MELSIVVILLFVLSTIEVLYLKIADRYNIKDKPKLRSSHTSITISGGGIIFLISVWFWELFYGIHYPWFLIGLSLIGIISFIDDIHSLPGSIRLVVQFISMLLLFKDLGIYSSERWWIIILTLILCVGIINAYNFMDGINGITGCYSLAVILPIIYLNQTFHFVSESLLIFLLISVLVFIFFNFRKKAKCFAGDVGSVSIAFILVFTIGRLVIETGDFIYLMLLAVYGIDSILTILHRVLLRENLTTAHRKHAYQIMSNELKIDHRVVAVIYMTMQLIISGGLILCDKYRWLYSILVTLGLVIAYIFFMKKYYHLHREYLSATIRPERR